MKKVMTKPTTEMIAMAMNSIIVAFDSTDCSTRRLISGQFGTSDTLPMTSSLSNGELSERSITRSDVSVINGPLLARAALPRTFP